MHANRGVGWLGRLAFGLALAGLVAAAGEARGNGLEILADIESRFVAREPPVTMEYDVGYRFLNIEWADVGRVVLTTTVGDWRHRVTGTPGPALLLDMRVDSPDSGRPGERRRVSMHDRMLIVLTVPDLKALLFAKHTDQFLNPLVGRSKEIRAISHYDAQSGQLEYGQTDLRTGLVTTNLANPEALLELSNRVGPLMAYLVRQCGSPSTDEDGPRIGVNLDGKVVALRLKTYPARSPSCLDRERPMAVCVTTEAERGSEVKPRDFHAWSMPFHQLALSRNDPALTEAARVAPVESVAPLVLDYELALGSVRATMTSIHAAHVGVTNALPLTHARPPPVRAVDRGRTAI